MSAVRHEAEVFIPHDACTVASGACFEDGRCLVRCQTQLSAADANRDLTKALRLLREMREYILMFRGVTRYVDGSGIDAAVKQAGVLLNRL